MIKILQFPVVRIVVAILFVGVGLIVGQTVLNLLRSSFAITDTGLANVIACVLITPATDFAYWLYVRFVEKREMTELGGAKAVQEFGLGALVGLGLFSLVIAILWLLGFYRVTGLNLVWLSLIGALA